MKFNPCISDTGGGGGGGRLSLMKCSRQSYSSDIVMDAKLIETMYLFEPSGPRIGDGGAGGG